MTSPDQRTTGGVRQGQHDKAGRRRALIESATGVFAECGYDAATTREVATRAGCAEGLIHRYFGGKQGLLIAILESKAQTITADLAGEIMQDLPDQPTVAEELRRLLERVLDVMWDHRDFMRVAISRAAIDPEVGRSIAGGVNRTRVQFVADKLRRHQQAGRIRADVDLEVAAELVVGLGFEAGFMAQITMGRDHAQVRRILAGAAEIIVRGLTSGAAADASPSPSQ